MINKEVKVSLEFKKHTTKAVLSILIFILSYSLILVLAVALTALCVFGGITLILFKFSYITLFLGAGLASLGVLILVFLLKFIFKSHKVDRSHLHKIEKAQEPQLFEMIDELVKQVGTSFPKNIYLSNDVNASVFYDSSFLSMFMPVKKNLQVGIGLVNTVTLLELKSILSHEFGHFSQKSMKVGSYVYNVNQIIFNMLYDNESYERLIEKWADISGFFSVFVIIAIKIIEGVQWILKKLYGFVNKNYMGLSREMEFHADEIAANITGIEPLKDSLLRLDLANYSFNSVVKFYENKISESVISNNIYKDHTFAIQFHAENSNLKLVNNLPIVTIDELSKFNKSKLVIQDQWASHPSTEDRIKRLDALKLDSIDNNKILAGEIFKNIDKTQISLTKKLFDNHYKSTKTKSIQFEDFKEQYLLEFKKNTFPKVFNNYYDDKNILQFDLEDRAPIDVDYDYSTLYSNKKVDLVYSAIALDNDISNLKLISENKIRVKTFDYDGQKYKAKDSISLISQLVSTLDNLNKDIESNDRLIYNFFSEYEIKLDFPPQLENYYKALFDFDLSYKKRLEIYSDLTSRLQFINEKKSDEDISSNFRKIRPFENNLKQEIILMLSDSRFQTALSKEDKEIFEKYTAKELKYYSKEIYYESNLELLFTSLNSFILVLAIVHFDIKKELLDYQEKLLISYKYN